MRTEKANFCCVASTLAIAKKMSVKKLRASIGQIPRSHFFQTVKSTTILSEIVSSRGFRCGASAVRKYGERRKQFRDENPIKNKDHQAGIRNIRILSSASYFMRSKNSLRMTIKRLTLQLVKNAPCMFNSAALSVLAILTSLCQVSDEVVRHSPDCYHFYKLVADARSPPSRSSRIRASLFYFQRFIPFPQFMDFGRGGRILRIGSRSACRGVICGAPVLVRWKFCRDICRHDASLFQH